MHANSIRDQARAGFESMQRPLVLALLFLIGLAAPATAQVAAPALTPFSFVTENPAAMQWGTPSRIGAGLTTGQTVTNPVSPSHDNGSGVDGGLRLVGARFSIAAEAGELQSDNKPNNNQAEYQNTARGALGVRLGDHLALGIGQSNEESQGAGIMAPTRVTLATPQFGASIRLGEWFFLGGALGTDYIKFEDQANAKNDFSTTRNVYKYGVGIRTAGSIRTHLEYYVVDRSRFTESSLPGGRDNARTGVAEFNFGGFLIGYATTHVERDQGQPTTDIDRGDIGYAPFAGLTIVARGQVETDKLPAGAPYKTQTLTTYTLALTYLFKEM